MPELVVLDVGHGSCAVVTAEDVTVLIDSGYGETLLEYLEAIGITLIDHALVSHADEDHVAGVIAVLNDPKKRIEHLHVNVDALRSTKVWQAFKSSVRDARLRGETKIHVGLTTNTRLDLPSGVSIRVVHPAPEVALSGAGGKDLSGRKLTAHSLCAVIRIDHANKGVALLMGDVDATGLANLFETGSDLKVPVLVYPHHGGRPGRDDPEEFARVVTNAVRPKLGIISTGREMYNNPLPETISGIHAIDADTHIACTQLSVRCAAVLPNRVAAHLARIPARGRPSRACCLGSMRINLDDPTGSADPKLIDHGAFITKYAATPLCRAVRR